ncbi:MAG: radical SAM family heme chaperone HemW [Nitrospirota bacterium]
MLHNNTMLSIYIHVPFCVRKCRYCGFFSIPFDSGRAENFLSMLGLELERRSSTLKKGPIGSIYIGGGTPTTLTSGQLARLFDLVDAHCRPSAHTEITVEANPHTANRGALSLLKDRGVTRLSIGVQSFSDDVLATLGRAHTAEQAFLAVHAAREAGFRNIGLDLIYGVPGQTREVWQETLESAVSLRPEHLSAYGLSLDEGSVLSHEAAAGRLTMPDDELVADMYSNCIAYLSAMGYRQYEVSNFSLPGHECMHNNNYWTRGEYLGFGPGAWSFIGTRRWANVADMSEYASRIGSGTTAEGTAEVLDRSQEAAEFLLLGLRRTAGIDLGQYRDRAGEDAADALQCRLGELAGAALFRFQGRRLMLTERGLLLSNDALSRILP